MAEPAGLLVSCQLSEAALNAWFRRKIVVDGERVPVARRLCALLDQGASGDVLIVHHDPAEERLFLAWMLNHYRPELLAPIWPVLEALAAQLDPTARAEGVIATTFPEAFGAVRLSAGRVDQLGADAVEPGHMEALSARLWRFARNGAFPDPASSMRARSCQCKAFRRAWKAYLSWRDTQERPARIAAATRAAPFNLLQDIFVADGVVFQRHDFTGRDIPFPGADALSFRVEAGYFADHAHVWQRQLAPGSPPETVLQGAMRVNNRAAIWEYRPIPGADGGTFRWLFDRFDTLFWRDGARVYAETRVHAEGAGRRLVPLDGVDPDGFRAYGRCFGTDGHHVHFMATPLQLNAAELQTEDLFIWDQSRVFIRDHELPFRGDGFRILARKRVKPNLLDSFRLTDGSRTANLTADLRLLADDPAF